MDHPALDQRLGTVGANPPCCSRTATHLVTHYRYSRKRRRQAATLKGELGGNCMPPAPLALRTPAEAISYRPERWSQHERVLWAATIRDTPDRAVPVLANEKSAVMRHC